MAERTGTLHIECPGTSSIQAQAYVELDDGDRVQLYPCKVTLILEAGHLNKAIIEADLVHIDDVRVALDQVEGRPAVIVEPPDPFYCDD